jgi:prepilin signal peptidase PulO-like enzyme (type II secretory pathway)
MEVSFLTPLAGLLALGALVTLAAFLVLELRARRVRVALGLAEPSLRSRLPLALSLAALPVLLGAAAAQPVLESTKTRRARGDAEALFVLDTSRSMLASARPSAPRRFERARSLALEVRQALPDVPVGLASLTNRLLPHLFPSADIPTFAATLTRSMGIQRPPPDIAASLRITTFAPLAALASTNFFSPRATRRLAVVFTDGETSAGIPAALRKALAARPGVHPIFVHVGNGDERVFTKSRLPEPAYRPDPTSGAFLDRLAAALGGEALPESNPDAIVHAARAALGEGVHVPAGTERRALPLAPYAAIAAFIPLLVVLRRRNL